MRTLLIITALVALITACKSEKKDSKAEKNTVTSTVYESFGEKITDQGYISAVDVISKYNHLKVGDTLNLKFTSSIVDLCSKKGCWMKLPVGRGDATIMVRFKDYGFFMPLDAKGKEVIVEGKAFVKETSVDKLKHYAEDAGKGKGEIAKIIEPKRTMSFEAFGVLMKKQLNTK